MSNAEDKKPVIVIADPESHEFYRAIPLWDEQVELYPLADPPYRSKPLHADLVLIDCGFDDDRGLSVLSEVKLGHPEIPVMFVTDAGSEETAVAAFRIGARDYINKPVGLLEFRNTIAGFLSVKRAVFGKRRRFIADTRGAVVKPRGPTGNDLPSNLLRTIGLLKENFMRPISIDQLAKEAGLSKCHFCRAFKKATGMTPMHFLSRMRIKRSKEFLRKNLPISSIAMKVGFNDLSSFNRHFKRFTGVTPTAYRNSLQEDSCPSPPPLNCPPEDV